MTLDELKKRLEIPPEDTSRDGYLEGILEEAIEWVQGACNQTFVINDVLTLPAVAKGIVAQYVGYELQGSAGIKSESIGGMSQTFDSVEERDQALISKLSKARLRKIRFRTFGGY